MGYDCLFNVAEIHDVKPLSRRRFPIQLYRNGERGGPN